MARAYPNKPVLVEGARRSGRAPLFLSVAGRWPWAGIDIFRFDEQGKIVAHWDVSQRVAKTV
ncbi:MAG: hypothetical protein JO061_22070 [Acidobacteriaceae bacterium]|nr:hypothetical protein [Acidobacteriaceae bacterium]